MERALAARLSKLEGSIRSFLLGSSVCTSLMHLLFDGIQVERCGLLHRRKFGKARGKLSHDVLNEYKAPKLECAPVVVVDRFAKARSLEEVQP
jgi:hypothetical protein